LGAHRYGIQIKDDLFDYTEEAIGKPTGIDIREQKMTLPLIHVLNTCTSKEKSWLINSIKTIIRTRGVLKK
jgi:octaprenyl-diphosphate synthase